MAQQMRMNSFRFQSCLRGESSEDQEHTGSGEAAAFRIQEELGAMARIQKRAAAAQITAKCLRRLPADRNDALLRTFPNAPHEPRFEVDARLVKRDGFAYPQARAVEELDQSAIAQVAWCGAAGSFDQPLGLGRGERARE